MRINLKNDYFSEMAKNINLAKVIKVKEEFWFCKNYTMTKNTTKTLMSNEKFVKLQPEVLNPENDPNILPPISR